MSDEVARKARFLMPRSAVTTIGARALGRFWPHLALVILCTGLYLPGVLTIPPVDRDESFFAQSTREMCETGNFVDAQYRGLPRHKKPVGIFWLQAASVKLLGVEKTSEIWPFRLPSFIGGLLAVLLTFALWQPVLGRRAALLGAALMACTVLMFVESTMGTADGPLLAVVVAAQSAMARCYLDVRTSGRPGLTWVLLFWGAVAVGVLLKGPVLPGLALFTVATLWAWDRRGAWIKTLRPRLGLVVSAAIVSPWLAATVWATDGRYPADLYQDWLRRLTSGWETHGAPPGYYTLASMVSFWPLTLFVPFALGFAWKKRNERVVRVCLAWIVPYWAFVELVPTKLPHYVLPVLPALALLTGSAVVAAGSGLPKLPAWLRGWLVFCGLLAAGLSAALFAIPWILGRGWDGRALLLGTVALVVSGAVIRFVARGSLPRAAWLSVAACAAVCPVYLSTVVPSLEALWISAQVKRTIDTALPSGATPALTATGYGEPSLVFLFGTRTAIQAPRGSAEFLAGGGSRFALVAEEYVDEFETTLQALGRRPARIRTLRGLEYNKGRWMTLHVYRAGARLSGSSGTVDTTGSLGELAGSHGRKHATPK